MVRRQFRNDGYLLLAVAGGWCTIFSASGAAASATQYHSSDPVTILSTAEMQKYGLLFPDMPLGFVRGANGQYMAFAGGGSVRDLGPGPGKVPFGTYKFTGTLDHLVPAKTSGQWPAYSLTNGLKQPSPDGSAFDRDYAAGGPTYTMPGSSTLLQIYHGEYHCGSNTGLPAYGASGMAVSTDAGDSFKKIGEILSPHVAQEDVCQSGKKAGFWADGGLIEADADGHRSAVGDAYDYILFVDHNAMDEPFIGISIARAKKADVLASIGRGTAPKFQKYYNSKTLPGSFGQFFTEPGVGGNSTPIVATRNVYIGTPGVLYDSYLRKFVLYYQFNQKHISLLTSDTLFEWSAPVNVLDIEQSADSRLFYPSLVGLGADPADLGKEFFVYYLERTPPNVNPRLMRMKLAVE
jgi:hypothetical protein